MNHFITTEHTEGRKMCLFLSFFFNPTHPNCKLVFIPARVASCPKQDHLSDMVLLEWVEEFSNESVKRAYLSFS